MKKMKTIQEFNLDNNLEIITYSQSKLISGGLAAEKTKDFCYSYNDTCDNGNSDLRTIRYEDNELISDKTVFTNMSTCE